MFADFSSMLDGNLTRITVATQWIEINSPQVRPIHQAPSRAAPAARVFDKEVLMKLTEMGVVEPTHTEWAAPTVFVPEKDGTLRFCVEYCKFNAVSVGDAYQIPRMDE